jgi:hypothetical protein
VTGGFLVVRRDGALWGLPADEVAAIERLGAAPATPAAATGTGAETMSRGYELRLTHGGTVAVDAVLTLAGDVRIQPLSSRLRRFLPQGSCGLAMLAGEPMVLLAREGEVPDV